MFRRVILIVLAMLMLAATPSRGESPREALSPEAQQRRDASVDRALLFILAHQQSDGSFFAPEPGQPGITGLCVLAFLSRGHLPGQGEYGRVLDRAVDFILSTQRADGLFTKLEPEPEFVSKGASQCAVYNHCIAGLVLSEIYGMRGGPENPRIAAAIDKALFWILDRQKLAGKVYPQERGGWRYLRPYTERQQGVPPHEADMSVTSWVMLFLRAAKNAGRDVPAKAMEDGLGFMARCFQSDGSFIYYPGMQKPSIALVGAGILAHSLAGKHDDPKAKAAAQYILRNPLAPYNTGARNRYHYATFYCTLAMFQIGGNEWNAYYPPLVNTLLGGQNPDGSWDIEVGSDNVFGNVYTTALTVMSLNTPRQMIPIFQR